MVERNTVLAGLGGLSPGAHIVCLDDVTGWEPITDQAAARAIPLVKVRQAGATTVVVDEAKPATRTAPPRRVHKPAVVIGR